MTARWRALPWRAVVLTSAAAAAALGSAWLAAPAGSAHVLTLLGICWCGAAASYILDEAAGPVLDASPTSRSMRLAPRLTVLGAPVAVGLGGLGGLQIISSVLPELSAGRMTLVLAGCVMVGIGTAGLLRIMGRATPGELASVLVAIGLPVALLVDPARRWASLLPPGDGGCWGGTVTVWGVLMATCLGVVLRALRDPAAGHRRC